MTSNVVNDSRARILESGNFHSGTHPTEGTATIYRIEDGSRVLGFTNFKTSNGPDVHVYMVAAEDAMDSASVRHADFFKADRYQEFSFSEWLVIVPLG
jgi:hypothetical protein